MPPRVRANQLKMAIGGVKGLPADRRDRFYELLGDDTRREIRDAGLLAWIDASYQTRVARVVHDVLGEEGARLFWRDHLLDAFDRPLMRPLRTGAITLWGATPAALMRRAPQAWKLITRDCGSPRFDSETSSRGTVLFTELPEPYRREPSVLGMWSGMLRACVESMQATGTIEEKNELADGRAAFVVDWR